MQPQTPSLSAKYTKSPKSENPKTRKIDKSPQTTTKHDQTTNYINPKPTHQGNSAQSQVSENPAYTNPNIKSQTPNLTKHQVHQIKNATTNQPNNHNPNSKPNTLIKPKHQTGKFHTNQPSTQAHPGKCRTTKPTNINRSPNTKINSQNNVINIKVKQNPKTNQNHQIVNPPNPDKQTPATNH